MKKIATTIILFAIVICSALAKDSFSTLTEAQTKALVCQKWKLSFLEFKGKRKDIPAKLPESLLIFLPDGNLQEFEGAKKYDGKWTYNHNTKTITTVDKDGTEKHVIIDISNDQFIMNGKYQGFTFNMGFKKMD